MRNSINTLRTIIIMITIFSAQSCSDNSELIEQDKSCLIASGPEISQIRQRSHEERCQRLIHIMKFNEDVSLWTERDMFIAEHLEYVQELSELSGIPSSIIMAQAIIESKHGTSALSEASNNLFGLKCFKKNCSDSHCVIWKDDRPDDRFLKFDHSCQSFEGHRRCLEKSRYSDLFDIDKENYQAWAFGLKACGYATNKKYATTIISVIKKHYLYQIDSF